MKDSLPRLNQVIVTVILSSALSLGGCALLQRDCETNELPELRKTENQTTLETNAWEQLRPLNEFESIVH